MTFDGDAIGRLLVAVALGAAIGIERETTEQPAGLRTHIAVCVGAALFGVVSTLGFSEFEAERASTNINIDVTRVASQVVVGIGFLGAGMIFRQGTLVRNLTTAASLWVTSAIGLTAGVGDLGTATVATAIMLVSLIALLPIRNWIRNRVARDERRVRITLESGALPSALIADLEHLDDVHVAGMQIDKADGAFVVIAQLQAKPGVELNQRLATLSARADVVTLGDA